MADQPAKKQKTDVETMGVSEMKALIKSAGLSSADCVEKPDLRARCREAQQRLAEAARLRAAAAPTPATTAPPAPAPAPVPAQPAIAPVTPADNEKLDKAFPDADWPNVTSIDTKILNPPREGGHGVWCDDDSWGSEAEARHLKMPYSFQNPECTAASLVLGAAKRCGGTVKALGVPSEWYGYGFRGEVTADTVPTGFLSATLPSLLPNVQHFDASYVIRRDELYGAIAAWPSLVSVVLPIGTSWKDRSWEPDTSQGRPKFVDFPAHAGLRYVKMPEDHTTAGILADVENIRRVCPHLECVDVSGLEFPEGKEPTYELAKLQRACRGRVRALVASVSQIFMTTPPCMREDGPMDMAEFLCETGDGMGVNLLDRPAEQFGQVFDDDPDPAATVNTIRRGLRELGLSA